MLETVVAHDFIGRLIVQSGRQPGLAQVMEALLGFGGHCQESRRGRVLGGGGCSLGGKEKGPKVTTPHTNPW